MLEENLTEFNKKQTKTLNSIKQKFHQKGHKLKLSFDDMAQQVLKAKLEVDTHCATESTTSEITFWNNVAHLEEAVSNIINSKQHKLTI